MLDHISIQVDDLAASMAFYDAALAPLGGRRLLEFDFLVAYGTDQPTFFVEAHGVTGPQRETHIAFAAADRGKVAAFYEAALAHGAQELHAPREWPEYHPGYFGAFVRDPDGHNVEAVCHGE
ncbi:VOC family protein [Lipingzhangella sp. LS1_29]|uniref:VOC family protein n=1 Tax=Lipingzhangella rawalii TaxID=2055835 RepID=A0ABU2H960_9ACTN|nr:VOC family protein [Lipingzhangella rawalii]MDS1271837.1 VOC family protein [Lipingzhangella rawalii]